MASMRARRPDSSASCNEELERLVGDAILRVVEVEARRLGRHPLAALGVVREESPEMEVPDLLVMGLRGLSRPAVR